MRILFSIFIVIFSLVFVPFTVMLGIDWLIIGYGLNPWIAFPLTLVGAINFVVHLHIVILDYKTFHLEQQNALMSEFIRLCHCTTTKL